jgi:hypothetical protein
VNGSYVASITAYSSVASESSGWLDEAKPAKSWVDFSADPLNSIIKIFFPVSIPTA